MHTFLVITLATYSKFKPTTIGDLKRAWDEGYDFKISGGPYCSNRDIPIMVRDGIEGVIIKSSSGHTIQVKF